MDTALADLPRLRRPAAVNAAEYWLAPERFARSCQRLGDRFLVPMPASGPWLCLTDPDDIKRVFTADTAVLRLGAALAKASSHHLFLGPTGLTNLDGPEHMRMRKMQLPPFHGRALPSYEETMERKTEEALADWPYGRRAPCQPVMAEITLEVIMATVFGVTDRSRVERLRAATLALLREGHSRRFFLQTMIATGRKNGWDRPFPRVRSAIAEVDRIVMEEVDQRRSRDEVDGEDVLGMFLRTPDQQGRLMSDDEICDAMRTLLLGGHDTTALTLTWVIERVSRSPDALSRLETAALDGEDEYLDAVIKEAMRLRPAFPLTGRLAAEPFELEGLTIPSGTMVVPYITLVHRRPELYPDPLAFRPERFLDTRAGTYTWIPFGGGPRRCIGAAFSMAESRIVLKTLLRQARVEPSRRRGERVAHRNVFIGPAGGGRVTLQRRAAGEKDRDPNDTPSRLCDRAGCS